VGKKIGFFGFAKRWLVFRAKPNVPICALAVLFLMGHNLVYGAF
jgi:hypothetical protein